MNKTLQSLIPLTSSKVNQFYGVYGPRPQSFKYEMAARAALFSATASFHNPPDFADALAYFTTKMTHMNC